MKTAPVLCILLVLAAPTTLCAQQPVNPTPSANDQTAVRPDVTKASAAAVSAQSNPDEKIDEQVAKIDAQLEKLGLELHKARLNFENSQSQTQPLMADNPNEHNMMTEELEKRGLYIEKLKAKITNLEFEKQELLIKQEEEE